MNAKELVSLKKEIEKLSWLKEAILKETDTKYDSTCFAYYSLRSVLRACADMLDETIKELKSLIDE